MFLFSFYPAKSDEIIGFIEKAMGLAEIKEDVSGAKAYVAPHAGYIYSGKTAAYAYKALSKKDDIEDIGTMVIVGPSHTGHGAPISISVENWKTPLGIIENDIELTNEIANAEGIAKDETAHQYEHSIEVHLPFIQHLFPGKKACFICMGDQSIEAAVLLSNAITHSAKKLKRNITVIGSSDFNHYEPASTASKKDGPLFEQLEKMDYKKFYELKENSHESSCGYGPITVSLLYAKDHKARKGVLLSNTNSGDTNREYLSVVNYAAFAFL